MSITVRFDKYGFYHPIHGRMGKGKYAGDVYTLGDIFAEEGMLPESAEILTAAQMQGEDFEELLEEQGQKKPHKPKVVDQDQLDKAKKRAAAAKKKKAEAAAKKAAAAKGKGKAA